MNSVVKNQSVKINLILQFLYRFVILAIPFIISPFLTRKLGDMALGNYTFINSIAAYFVMFANLGIFKHGQRAISKAINDETKIRKTFWSLFTLHAVISVVIAAFYIGYVIFFTKDNFNVYVIETIYVISALFDITWLFYGLEDFKSVVFKNFIIKIVECVLIFVFIKTPNDLWIYALITSVGLLLGHLILIPQAIKIIKPIKFSKSDVLEHIKPLLIFFVSIVAVSLYTIFDKTLLGMMSTKENVAYYEYADKVVALPRTFITIIGTVLFPRACKLAEKKDLDGQRRYMNLSLMVVSFIGMASMFGLLAVSKQFSIIYYGEKFSESGSVMMAMCALPLINGLGDVVRTQYMIPNGMDKEYTICVIANSILNLVLSIILIPSLGIYGAVIGTVSAELMGTIVQVFICRKCLSIKYMFKTMVAFCVIGLLMFVVLIGLKKILDGGLFFLVIQIGVGALIFVILSILYIRFFEKETWILIMKRRNKE